MTAFTLTTNRNFDELTTGVDGSAAKTGADTYALNGFRLTIDGDTRFDKNCTATTGSAASFTTSATLGGELRIDGSNVWLIPFDGGSGSIPARGTAITQAGVTGKLIGVWTAINAAPVADLGAMPATGWIKVKQVTGTYAAGALGGLTANATGAAVRGWIEVCCNEAGTVTVHRLGKFVVRGDFFKLGETSGAAHQTMDLPTSGGTTFWVPYVEVSDGAGGWEMWPCLTAGTNGGWTTAAQGTTVRSKFVQQTGALIRFGGDGTNLIGYVPPAGREVRIPNVFLQNNTTAARDVTALPNATPGSRFETVTTSAGVIDIENCSCCWYLNCSQPYSVRLSHVGIADTSIFSEVAAPLDFSFVCIGVTSPLDVIPIALTSNFAGGTITDCSFGRAGAIGSADNSANVSYCIGQTFTRCFFWQGTLRTNAAGYPLAVSYCADLNFTDCKCVGQTTITASQRVTVTNHHYWDRMIGSTASATATNAYAVAITTFCNTIKVDGLDYAGLDDVGPYNGLFLVTSSANVKLRNVGTPAVPFNLGTTSTARPGLVMVHGGNSTGLVLQRIYVYNTRTNIVVGVNSDKGVVYEHVWGDYADALNNQNLNGITKGGRQGSGTPTSAFTSVYGTHFWDVFISDTAGRVGVFCNEPTAQTAALVTLTGTAAFNSGGSVFLPAVNDSVTWEWPHFVLGHTRFANSAVVCTGGTTVSARMNFYFDVDFGSGWAGWSVAYTNLATLGTALYNLGAIAPATGFKLRLRVTANTASVNNTINVLYATTVTDTTSMRTQYPLDTYTLTITGLVPGSDVVVLTSGTNTVVGEVDANASSSWAYVFGAASTVDIGVLKEGYVPLYIRGYPLGLADVSLPVAQVADRAFA